MKVGDKVRHKNHEGIATIISFKVERIFDDFKQRPITKTSYQARYDDTGALIKFYGYDINKRIFKVDGGNKQLSFFDFI